MKAVARFVFAALFVLATLLLSQSTKDRTSTGVFWLPILALLLFGAKVIFEMVSGQAIFVEAGDGIRVVPLAHFVGAIAGLLAFACKGPIPQPLFNRN